MVFLHQKGDSESAVRWKRGVFWHGVDKRT